MRLMLRVLALLALLVTPLLPAHAAAMLVDINSADAATLDALPGIGDVRGKAIIAGRPYTDKKDLLTKKILPQNIYDGIKDKIALANINTATAKDMVASLPGIGEARAADIVKNRPYAAPEDLVTKKVLTKPVYDKIAGMITVK